MKLAGHYEDLRPSSSDLSNLQPQNNDTGLQNLLQGSMGEFIRSGVLIHAYYGGFPMRRRNLKKKLLYHFLLSNKVLFLEIGSLFPGAGMTSPPAGASGYYNKFKPQCFFPIVKPVADLPKRRAS
jgi:hypothetical protein